MYVVGNTTNNKQQGRRATSSSKGPRSGILAGGSIPVSQGSCHRITCQPKEYPSVTNHNRRHQPQSSSKGVQHPRAHQQDQRRQIAVSKAITIRAYKLNKKVPRHPASGPYCGDREGSRLTGDSTRDREDRRTEAQDETHKHLDSSRAYYDSPNSTEDTLADLLADRRISTGDREDRN